MGKESAFDYIKQAYLLNTPLGWRTGRFIGKLLDIRGSIEVLYSAAGQRSLPNSC